MSRIIAHAARVLPARSSYASAGCVTSVTYIVTIKPQFRRRLRYEGDVPDSLYPMSNLPSLTHLQILKGRKNNSDTSHIFYVMKLKDNVLTFNCKNGNFFLKTVEKGTLKAYTIQVTNEENH